MPDLILFGGVVDDLVVIPFAIALMVHLIPEPLRAELRQRVEVRMAENRPHSHIPEAIAILCVVGIAAIVSWLIWFR